MRGGILFTCATGVRYWTVRIIPTLKPSRITLVPSAKELTLPWFAFPIKSLSQALPQLYPLSLGAQVRLELPIEPGWPGTLDSPVSASCVLGLLDCFILLFSCLSQSWGFPLIMPGIQQLSRCMEYNSSFQSSTWHPPDTLRANNN